MHTLEAGVQFRDVFSNIYTGAHWNTSPDETIASMACEALMISFPHIARNLG